MLLTSKMECEFCNNTFSSKSVLLHHQRTAKYCLVKRGKNATRFKCSYCGKTRSTKQNLKSHYLSCFEYRKANSSEKHETDVKILNAQLSNFQEQIKQKDLQIQTLQDKLENIAIKAACRSTTTNNINAIVQNMQPVTEKYIESQIPNLTIEHIKKGPQGYAEYAVNYPFKNRIICVDSQRRKIKFKDEEGNLTTDPEMEKLSTILFKGIEEHNNALINEFINGIRENLQEDDNDFSNPLISEVQDLRNMVKDGANGEKTSMTRQFVKEVCNKTIVD